MHGIHNAFSTIHTKVGERCFNALLVTTKGSSNELLDMVILLLAFLGILYVTFDKKKTSLQTYYLHNYSTTFSMCNIMKHFAKWKVEGTKNKQVVSYPLEIAFKILAHNNLHEKHNVIIYERKFIIITKWIKWISIYI